MLPENVYKEIYSKVPRLTVEIVVETEKGYVYTLRNIPPWKGYWHIPGGTVYYKESLKQAVKRIAKKELGIEVTIKEFLGYIEYDDTSKFGGFDHPVGLAFLVKPNKGTLKTDFQSKQVKTFKYFPKKLIIDQRRFLKRLSNPL